MAKKTPRNLKFERHLKTRELHIRHKVKLIYMIYAQICTNPNSSCLQKMRLSIRGERGRREGILKLLVKVSLKLERSFGNLLHINPQKMCPNWYGSLLIITSPSTSSYSFSLSFSGHWHSKSFLPSQKPCKTVSVNFVFSNIEIKKNF